MLLELADLRQTARELRELPGCHLNCILIACLDTFSALRALKLIDHMDELRLALNSVGRTYIQTIAAAGTGRRININMDEGCADACRTLILLDVGIKLIAEPGNSRKRRPGAGLPGAVPADEAAGDEAACAVRALPLLFLLRQPRVAARISGNAPQASGTMKAYIM